MYGVIDFFFVCLFLPFVLFGCFYWVYMSECLPLSLLLVMGIVFFLYQSVILLKLSFFKSSNLLF